MLCNDQTKSITQLVEVGLSCKNDEAEWAEQTDINNAIQEEQNGYRAGTIPSCRELDATAKSLLPGSCYSDVQPGPLEWGSEG